MPTLIDRELYPQESSEAEYGHRPKTFSVLIVPTELGLHPHAMDIAFASAFTLTHDVVGPHTVIPSGAKNLWNEGHEFSS